MVWHTKQFRRKRPKVLSGCALPQQLQAAYARTHLEHNCALNIQSEPSIVRLTGIICKIGPSSLDVETLEDMIANGMDIACLNFSHGLHDLHAETLRNIRTAAANYSKKVGVRCPIGIALETKGPQIRTGFPLGGRCVQIELKEGQTIQLTTDPDYVEKGSAEIMYVDYGNIDKAVQAGTRLFIDEGRIALRCTLVEEGCVTCTVQRGGFVGSRRPIRLPGRDVDLPTLTKKDRADLQFGLEQGVHIVFASFVRSAAAVQEVREALGEGSEDVMVLAKVENEQALRNIDEIIRAADGVVLCRQNLGVEMPLQDTFLIQKAVAAKCNAAGKPVVCVNHVLDSMVKIPRPSKAESSDVANAVLDGVDCIMLCKATARGDYPVECVGFVADLCREAASARRHTQTFSDLSWHEPMPYNSFQAVAIAAVKVAFSCEAAAIVVVTNSMTSARLLSKYSPRCPIIAVTRDIVAARQGHLSKGVLPLLYKANRASQWDKDMYQRVYYGVTFGRNQGFLKSGDVVVMVSAGKQGVGFTDQMSVITLDESMSHESECECL